MRAVIDGISASVYYDGACALGNPGNLAEIRGGNRQTIDPNCLIAESGDAMVGDLPVEHEFQIAHKGGRHSISSEIIPQAWDAMSRFVSADCTFHPERNP